MRIYKLASRDMLIFHNIEFTGGSDDNRRNYAYHNLVKKLKKEIGDKTNASIKFLRQLLPLPKVGREVIVTEPFGTINDGKGTSFKWIFFLLFLRYIKFLFLCSNIY